MYKRQHITIYLVISYLDKFPKPSGGVAENHHQMVSSGSNRWFKVDMWQGTSATLHFMVSFQMEAFYVMMWKFQQIVTDGRHTIFQHEKEQKEP